MGAATNLNKDYNEGVEVIDWDRLMSLAEYAAYIYLTFQVIVFIVLMVFFYHLWKKMKD
jgi:hypothetical protein